jgi:hypothetical protein
MIIHAETHDGRKELSSFWTEYEAETTPTQFAIRKWSVWALDFSGETKGYGIGQCKTIKLNRVAMERDGRIRRGLTTYFLTPPQYDDDDS